MINNFLFYSRPNLTVFCTTHRHATRQLTTVQACSTILPLLSLLPLLLLLGNTPRAIFSHVYFHQLNRIKPNLYDLV